MRKIICYRRGCNNRAQWTIPGKAHLCTTHMRELFPNRNITVQRVGPTEFKDLEEEDGARTATT